MKKLLFVSMFPLLLILGCKDNPVESIKEPSITSGWYYGSDSTSNSYAIYLSIYIRCDNDSLSGSGWLQTPTSFREVGADVDYSFPKLNLNFWSTDFQAFFHGQFISCDIISGALYVDNKKIEIFLKRDTTN